MKKGIVFFALLILTAVSFAQIKSPAKWTYAAKKVGAGMYEVAVTVNLEKGWHIYSQHTPEGGPVPTSFDFIKNPLVTLQGSIKENGKLETHFEKLFGVDVKQFSNKVIFVQKVKVKANAKTSLSGNVEFMLCNDRECLPPTTQKFSVALK